VRVYATAARLSFRRYMSYRSSFIAGAFTNTVFGFIRAAILLALWSQKPEIAGYDAADAVTYTFLTQALITPLALFSGTTELSQRIRTGDVAVDLYRPCDLQGWFLAGDAGRAGASLVLRTLPPVVAGALVYRLSLPAAPLIWLEFAASVLVALLISFAIRYLVSVSAFWTLDERGAASMLAVVAMFCSGMIVPLGIMPGRLSSLCYALPWSSMLQVPINILLGAQPGGFGPAFGIQLLWAAALLGLGRLCTAAARHKVVVQGG
jgi:ABC-2 type transport system permease protein